MPHGLIAAYAGDTVLASQKFLGHMPESIRLVTLVDFDNDCVATSSGSPTHRARLYGVRLDTGEMVVDRRCFR